MSAPILMLPRILAPLLAALLLCGPLPLRAEKADRDQPVNITADHGVSDEKNNVTTFTGSVVLTQGTLTIRADRLQVTQDARGNYHGTAWGKPATFRQKRDKVDEWVEGEALRLVYDGAGDRLELHDQARLNREGDVVSGRFISYDNATQFFEVKSGAGDGRVKAVIQPRAREDAAKPASNGEQ